jgi:hypothetical protein
MSSEPATAGPRLTTAAETLLLGVFVCATSLPVVTALAAAGAGGAALREFAESGTPVRARRFAALLRAAHADPVAWAVPPVLVVTGVLDVLAVAGGLPGRAVVGPALVLAGGAALVVCATGAARWRPGARWSSVLREGAGSSIADPFGSVLVLAAFAVVALVVSAEPAFAVIAPGLVLLAAVAVERRRTRS